MSVTELYGRPSGPHGVTANRSVSDVTSDLLEIIRNHTKQPGTGWSAETTMEEVGIDSFDFVELIFAVEERYNISIDINANKDKEGLSTVGDVAAVIVANLNGAGK